MEIIQETESKLISKIFEKSGPMDICLKIYVENAKKKLPFAISCTSCTNKTFPFDLPTY